MRTTAEVLSAASVALTRTLDLDSVLATLFDHLAELVPYDSANVMLVEGEARLSARRGYDAGPTRRGPPRSLSTPVRTPSWTRS